MALTRAHIPAPPNTAMPFFACAVQKLKLAFSLHCALASCGVVYCNRSCLWICMYATGGRACGRAVSEPYYSQRARSVCVSLSAFFIFVLSRNSFIHFAHSKTIQRTYTIQWNNQQYELASSVQYRSIKTPTAATLTATVTFKMFLKININTPFKIVVVQKN